MTILEIIGVAFSNYVRSVRMLCEEKGLTYTHIPAFPHSPEVAAIHPAGQVPVMRHGDVTLFESKAIATYIDRAFPGPKLIPADAVGHAKLEQWVSYANAKVDPPVMREFVVPQVFFDKAKGPDMARVGNAIPQIEACCAALDAAVSKTGYLVGGALTYADLHVVPMLTALQRFPAGSEIISRHPALVAHIERIAARPSFSITAPPPRA